MSKQGIEAYKRLKRLLQWRVSTDNVKLWIGHIEGIDELYSKDRKELVSVTSCFAGDVDLSDAKELAETVKFAKCEMRAAIKRIKRDNHIND